MFSCIPVLINPGASLAFILSYAYCPLSITAVLPQNSVCDLVTFLTPSGFTCEPQIPGSCGPIFFPEGFWFARFFLISEFPSLRLVIILGSVNRPTIYLARSWQEAAPTEWLPVASRESHSAAGCALLPGPHGIGPSTQFVGPHLL